MLIDMRLGRHNVFIKHHSQRKEARFTNKYALLTVYPCYIKSIFTINALLRHILN